MDQELLSDRKNALFLNVAFFICAALLFVLLAMFCFYRLGDKPIYDFDEARHGASAYEMMQSGEWIVTTFRGKPDYWNLKPPLSEWAICGFFALLGYTKTAFRAYSAISMLLHVLLLFVWSWRKSGKAGALFTVLAVLAIEPFWMINCARAGDPNSLYFFLCTISTISLAEAFDRNPKYLILSCLCASLAFLTKSFHAVILVAELVAALVILRKQIHLSKATVLLSLAALILPAGIWALLRYRCDGTTFLSEMLFTDVLHRSTEAVEGHVGGVAYYFEYLFSDLGTLAGLTAIPAGLALIKKHSNWHVVVAISVLVPLCLFTVAKTKIAWYIFSVFPGIALLGGDGIQRIVDSEQKRLYKCLALCLPVFIAALAAYHSVYGIIIYPVKTSAVQSAMEVCLDREDETSSRTIYLDLKDDEYETWTQAHYLVIQLAGDCQAADGSIDDWKNDEDALLFTTEDSNSVSEGQIIRSYGGYCLLAH